MHVTVYPSADRASRAAADVLVGWLADARTLVVAGGNSPRELYRLVADRRPAVDHLNVFTLDEYLGVPVEHPGTCANLLRREVADAWGVPAERFHWLSSRSEDAAAGIAEHERKLAALGGIDAVVLGLGKNGHLGFNEPGSAPDSPGRVLDLTPTSIAANAEWFGGEYAPDQGVTLGLGTLLAARRVLLVAFGPAKADAVHDTVVAASERGVPGVVAAATPRGAPVPRRGGGRPPAAGPRTAGRSDPMPADDVWAVGLDVGGTKIAGGLVRFPAGEVVARRRVPTRAGGTPRTSWPTRSRWPATWPAAVPSGGRFAGVGLGMPELVDLDGRLASGATIDWRGISLADRFAGVGPVWVEADVRAAALAEARFGAGRRVPAVRLRHGRHGHQSHARAGRPAVRRGAGGTPSCWPAGRPVSAAPGAAPGSRTVLEDGRVRPGHRGRRSTVDRAEDVLAAADRGDPPRPGSSGTRPRRWAAASASW